MYTNLRCTEGVITELFSGTIEPSLDKMASDMKIKNNRGANVLLIAGLSECFIFYK